MSYLNNSTSKPTETTMKGTSGSTFIVAFENAIGKVGFRNLGGSEYRVRVEPAVNAEGFSNKGGHSSTVVEGVTALAKTLSRGQKALTFAAIQ